MDEEGFKIIAKKHLISLCVWLVGLLLVTVFGFEMRYWAESLRGWQSDVVSGLFLLVSSISGLGALFFSGFIYSWFKEYKVALSSAKTFDIERMQNIYSSVVGPIPWK